MSCVSYFRNTSGSDNIYSVGMENSTDFCQVQITPITTVDWQIIRECHSLLVQKDLTMQKLKYWSIFQTLIMVSSGLKWLIIHILLACKSKSMVRDRTLLHAIYFSISNYAQISTEDSVIILGGYAKTPKGSHRGQLRKSNWGPSDVIAEYKAGVWNQIGTLLQPRYGHCASAYAGKAYVVGGGEGGK